MANILVATLGESPIVVSATVKALYEQRGIDLQQVYVVYPEHVDLLEFGYELIEKAVEHLVPATEVLPIPLPDVDIYTTEGAKRFLLIFTHLLKELGAFSQGEDRIYVSLAGGTQMMSTLALLPCQVSEAIHGLLHLSDKNEGTAQELGIPLESLLSLPEKEQFSRMLPSTDDVYLMDIPILKTPHKNEFWEYILPPNRDVISIQQLQKTNLSLIENPKWQAFFDSLLSEELIRETSDYLMLQQGSLEQGILILPLGESPAIVFQTYKLFENAGKQLRKVIVIYPEEDQTVRQTIDWLRKGFRAYNPALAFQSIAITEVHGEEEGFALQRALVDTFVTQRRENPDAGIWLSIADAREPISLFTLQSAQITGISHVYHTVISDPSVKNKIIEEGAIPNLERMLPNKRRQFLFREDFAIGTFGLIRLPIVLFDYNTGKGDEREDRVVEKYKSLHEASPERDDSFFLYLVNFAQAKKLHDRGKYDEAKHSYLQSLEFIKGDKKKIGRILNSICEIGFAFIKKRNFPAALKAYQDVLAISPDYVPALDGESFALLLTKVNESTKEEYRKALRLLKESRYVTDKPKGYKEIILQEICRIGERCYETENPVTRLKAIIAYKTALEIDGNYEDAKLRIVELEDRTNIEQRGSYEDIKELFDCFLEQVDDLNDTERIEVYYNAARYAAVAAKKAADNAESAENDELEHERAIDSASNDSEKNAAKRARDNAKKEKLSSRKDEDSQKKNIKDIIQEVLNIGDRFFEKGADEKAIIAYETALAIDVDHPESEHKVDEFYHHTLMEQARQCVICGSDNEALTLYVEAIEFVGRDHKKADETIKEIFKVGDKKYRLGKYDQAIEIYRKISEIRSNEGKAFYKIATIYFIIAEEKSGDKHLSSGKQLESYNKAAENYVLAADAYIIERENAIDPRNPDYAPDRVKIVTDELQGIMEKFQKIADYQLQQNNYQNVLLSSEKGIDISKSIESGTDYPYREQFLEKIAQVHLKKEDLEKAFDTYLEIHSIALEEGRIREKIQQLGYVIRKKHLGEDNSLIKLLINTLL